MHVPRSTKHTSNPQKNVNKANTQLCQIDNSKMLLKITKWCTLTFITISVLCITGFIIYL